MQEEIGWNCIESIFKKIPLPYPILSIVFSFIIFLIYLILSPCEKRDCWLAVYASCFVIVYLLIGNQYLINKMRIIIQNLGFIPQGGSYKEELYDLFKKYFIESKTFYLVNLGIVLYFIILDLIRYYIYNIEVFFSSNALNVYNYAMFFFELYLLATVLWIIINIYMMLKRIESRPYRDAIKIDILSVDRAGGFGQLRDFILMVIIYYSLGISLIVLSYEPTGYKNVYFEIGFIILLLLIGVILLIAGLLSIKKLYSMRMVEQINLINEKYLEQYRRIIEIISKQEVKSNENELQFLSRSLEWLQKERNERVQILNDNRYNLKAGVTTLASIILTILTIYEKLTNYGLVSAIQEMLRGALMPIK